MQDLVGERMQKSVRVKLAKEAKPKVHQCQAQNRVQVQMRAQARRPQERVRHRVGWLAGLGAARLSLK